MSHAVTIKIVTGTVSPTSTGVDGALDVGFTFYLEGVKIEGEVTLVPRDCGGGYGTWGLVDNWLDGRTLGRLRWLSDRDFRDVLSEISASCSEAYE